MSFMRTERLTGLDDPKQTLMATYTMVPIIRNGFDSMGFALRT